ncbi:MAG: TraR/DksA family transcriptional regulator [Actinobacteria bacterium]|nr:TraR/DksA family transcriptional regulator [Actinomycetota bacterium]
MDDDKTRTKLLQERDRLLREIDELEDGLAVSLADTSEESPYDQHMAEAAAFTQERQMDLTLEENARHGLARVERALKKLDDGSYGVCDACAKAIGHGRLNIAPDASLCIDCQRLTEKGL